MPGLVTRYFHNNVAEQFFESVTESDSTKYYLFISKVLAWANPSVPDTFYNTVNFTDYDVWNNMIAVKKVTAADISYSIPRFNWTTGNVYWYYDCANTTFFDVATETPASANTFYVYIFGSRG